MHFINWPLHKRGIVELGSSMRNPPRSKKRADQSQLQGQLLIAMPTMSDKRFQRSVIYMCAHSSESAMGLIINQRARNVSFGDLMRQLKVTGEEGEAAPPFPAAVYVGGPVSTQRGFVLHSDDYIDDATLKIADGICLTATMDILKSIAVGKGPKRSLLALGYSGWSGGQLESEIHANGWLHVAADAELVFGADIELKYDRALSKLGVNPSHLVSEAGHA